MTTVHQLPVKPVATDFYIKVVNEYILHQEIKKIALSEDMKYRLRLIVAKEMASEPVLLKVIKEAKNVNIPSEKVNQLLVEDFLHFPASEQTTLSYAMHVASNHGEVDEQRYIDYVHQVGCSKACAVSKYLKGLMIAYTRNNAVDALKQRITGQPVAKSSVAQELGVITAGLWAYPTAYAKKVWQQTKR